MVWDSGVEHEDRCNADSLGFVVGEESRSALGRELDDRRFSVRIQTGKFSIGKPSKTLWPHNGPINSIPEKAHSDCSFPSVHHEDCGRDHHWPCKRVRVTRAVTDRAGTTQSLVLCSPNFLLEQRNLTNPRLKHYK